MSGYLPSSFDDWFQRESARFEEPCDVTLRKEYECTECGGEFNDADIKTQNFILSDHDEDGWKAKHKNCKENFNDN